MDTKSVWDFLSRISVGQIVAWASVLIAIITALCAGTIKLYKVFTKYEEIKRKDREEQKIIENHDAILKKIEDILITFLRDGTSSYECLYKVNKKTIVKILSILEEELPKLEFNVNYKLWLDSLFSKMIGGVYFV